MRAAQRRTVAVRSARLCNPVGYRITQLRLPAIALPGQLINDPQWFVSHPPILWIAERQIGWAVNARGRYGKRTRGVRIRTLPEGAGHGAGLSFPHQLKRQFFNYFRVRFVATLGLRRSPDEGPPRARCPWTTVQSYPAVHEVIDFYYDPPHD